MLRGLPTTDPPNARDTETIDRFNRVVLLTVLWVLPLVFLLEWIPEVIAGDPGMLPRWYTYLVFWGTAIIASRMKRPNALILLAPGIAYLGTTTVLEATVAENIGGADAGTSLALLVGLSVVVGAVTTRGFFVVIAALSLVTAMAALFTGLDEGLDAAELLVRVVTPVLVLGLSAWILRRLRHDLSASRDHLEDLVEGRDRLVAAVSHELRTPLTGIVGLAEELAVRREQYSEEELDEFTSIIAEQGREMADIIDDLLVAARVDAESLVVQIEQVALRAEVDRVLKAPRFVDHVTLGRITIEGGGTEAYGDALRCRQILRNLVSNALRYGGDRITITIGSVRDMAHVTVADNGSGLNAEMADRVFDPYYTANNGQTMPGAVGLGLPVSRRLARVMGGDVTCRLDEGMTIFHLELPLVPGLRLVEGSGWGP